MSYELHNGPIPSGQFVLHSCDNRRCVNPNHLSLGRHLKNAQDMIDHGRSKRGAKHFAAILTKEAVNVARTAHANGTTIGSLAKHHGVARATMADAIHGRTWAWV